MKKRGVINLFFIFVILFSFFSISFVSVSASTLRVTQEHPFLVNGEWISASQLKIGDLLTTVGGKHVVITNITDITSEDNFSVYNLEAKQYSNFVVGSDKVVVHNSHLPNGETIFFDTRPNGVLDVNTLDDFARRLAIELKNSPRPTIADYPNVMSQPTLKAVYDSFINQPEKQIALENLIKAALEHGVFIRELEVIPGAGGFYHNNPDANIRVIAISTKTSRPLSQLETLMIQRERLIHELIHSTKMDSICYAGSCSLGPTSRVYFDKKLLIFRGDTTFNPHDLDMDFFVTGINKAGLDELNAHLVGLTQGGYWSLGTSRLKILDLYTYLKSDYGGVKPNLNWLSRLRIRADELVASSEKSPYNLGNINAPQYDQIIIDKQYSEGQGLLEIVNYLDRFGGLTP